MSKVQVIICLEELTPPPPPPSLLNVKSRFTPYNQRQNRSRNKLKYQYKFGQKGSKRC